MDAKTIEVKRDIALLFLKMGKNDQTIQSLKEVEDLERQVFGPTSVSLARTLKALGTIYLSNRNVISAKECFLESLQIFESNPNCQQEIKEIHLKLKNTASRPMK